MDCEERLCDSLQIDVARSGNSRMTEVRFVTQVISRCLIMWDHMLPTTEWLHSLLPPIVSAYAFKRTQASSRNKIDYETVRSVKVIATTQMVNFVSMPDISVAFKQLLHST